MTGFETATLAFHAASLGWREISAWATVGGVAGANTGLQLRTSSRRRQRRMGALAR